MSTLKNKNILNRSLSLIKRLVFSGVVAIVLMGLASSFIENNVYAKPTEEQNLADMFPSFAQCIDNVQNSYRAYSEALFNNVDVSQFNANINSGKVYTKGVSPGSSFGDAAIFNSDSLGYGGSATQPLPIGFGIDSDPAKDDGGRYCQNMEEAILTKLDFGFEDVKWKTFKSFLIDCLTEDTKGCDQNGFRNNPGALLDGLRDKGTELIRSQEAGFKSTRNYRVYSLFLQCYSDKGDASSGVLPEPGWVPTSYNGKYWAKNSDNIKRLAGIWYPNETKADDSIDKQFPVGFRIVNDDARMSCATAQRITFDEDLANAEGVKEDPPAPPSSTGGGGTTPPPAAASDADICLSDGDNFISWAACPVVGFVDSLLEWVQENLIESQLKFDLEQTNTASGNGMKTAWGVFRTIASLVIIIGFLIALLVKAVRGE